MWFRRKKAETGDPVVREVPIRDEGIRLGQFLKLADLIDTGAEVKPLMIQGEVAVNGEVETRRGRQLGPRDVVTQGPAAAPVATRDAEIDVPW